MAVPERIDLQGRRSRSIRWSKLDRFGHLILGLRVGAARKHQLVFEICTFSWRCGTRFTIAAAFSKQPRRLRISCATRSTASCRSRTMFTFPRNIRRYGLRTGNFVRAVAGPRAKNGKAFFRLKKTVASIEDIPAEQWQPPKPFDKLTALFPRERIIL